MISLPDFDKAFEYENNFYLSSPTSRMHKPIIHYELYKRTIEIPGAFVELGLFKGTSFVRFLAYRQMLENGHSRKFIGFDTFGNFPEPTFVKDQLMLSNYLEAAGTESISKDQLEEVLRLKGVANNVELIAGDINQTVPIFVKENPHIRFSLIHLDVDLYEPSVTTLKHLYPLLSKGGIIILDDYGIWEGEIKAVDEFLKTYPNEIHRFPFAAAPSYIVKK